MIGILKSTPKLHPEDYTSIVFFTGAGMSAESGVPTYRGKGGIWHKYRWEEYACQEAFDRNPKKVLKFHEKRRKVLFDCQPHAGHHVIADIEKRHPQVTVVTQNIDGMHQRAGSEKVIELHGSAWRLRCTGCSVVTQDFNKSYKSYTCECGSWLRPDIIWFGDMLNENVITRATKIIGNCDLFISIGTSGAVWPAAGFPQLAKSNEALCLEINPELSEMSYLYDELIRGKAGDILPELFETIE